MRIMLDFPEGFGSDPAQMMGSVASQAPSGTAAARSSAAPSPSPLPSADPSPLYVPGPFRAHYDSGFASPSAVQVDLMACGGFRPMPDADPADEEPVFREPQSVVVVTIVVGLILAAMGYFLDVG